MSPINTFFTVCSGLSVVLVLIPRPWHFECASSSLFTDISPGTYLFALSLVWWADWNTGALVYRFWVAFGTLNLFIDSIIWRNDAAPRAEIWCEICKD